ncbi:putative E3 ubiquitin-protein ligase UBR7 [Sitophilus oryzae]|uniref:E3 ubiquitin-protein ligase UBR7 n=1 Tax=Sitophilus oryzae TaxID=7048 RepID=A0A6J2YU85_SITOR|nr:putative E3 ubiquitin-protein ligase UBR7 [Sitophilus oryzae]
MSSEPTEPNNEINPDESQLEESTEETADADDSAGVVTLTLNDVLELEDELIETTGAILGAANDKACSYTEGYLKRQALYSCLTCIPEAKDDPEKGAGVCLACSYHCHDGHELIELYTKRNFRCDCGNNKFAVSKNKCNLCEDKASENDLNVYNQNFSGTYCVCHRPYPDVEDPVPDEMIQCIICEDWYHSRHLGVEVPSDNFAEMTCELCITKHEFLLHYDDLTTNKSKKTTDETAEVNVTETNNDDDSSMPPDCKMPKTKSERSTARFWVDASWRKQLCTCDECLKMYEAEDVAFLLDHEDPVHLYEEKSKAKAKAMVENEDKKFINSLDRVQLIEAIAGYNDLKENLGQYLKKFAENKKVVREEDIKEFFEGMKARKKARVEIPYNCR